MKKDKLVKKKGLLFNMMDKMIDKSLLIINNSSKRTRTLDITPPKVARTKTEVKASREMAPLNLELIR